MVTRSAAQFASHGFAVLALPYYSPGQWPTFKRELPELPAAFADIPVERLNEARDWLKGRIDVDASRIAIKGTSKGAEFALLAGVHLPWGDIHRRHRADRRGLGRLGSGRERAPPNPASVPRSH